MNPARLESLTGPTSPQYLLDVNILLASIWSSHPQHDKTFKWLSGKSILVCAVTELGFLRISTNKKAINAPMEKARDLLSRFETDRRAINIPCDLKTLDSHPQKSEEVTDHYLADLASLHGARLATLDQNLIHSSVDVIT